MLLQWCSDNLHNICYIQLVVPALFVKDISALFKTLDALTIEFQENTVACNAYCKNQICVNILENFKITKTSAQNSQPYNRRSGAWRTCIKSSVLKDNIIIYTIKEPILQIFMYLRGSDAWHWCVC